MIVSTYAVTLLPLTHSQMVHSVRIAPPRYPLRRHPEDMLDLNPAVDEEFTLDKLRSQLERFYSSVIFGLIRVGKEARRIRNWEDGGRRTKVALAVSQVGRRRAPPPDSRAEA